MMVLYIVASFLLAALVPVIFKSKRVIEFASVVANGVALVLSGATAYKVGPSGTFRPFSFLSIDALGAITMLIVAVVGFAAAVYSIPYFRVEMQKKIIGISRIRQYYALANLFMAAMFIATTASHPVVAWIFLEATTLTTAFLISFYNRRSTIEAAWKYLIINAIGLLLGFFGTLLYFTSLDAASGFVSWDALLAGVSHLNPAVAQLAFVFVLIGYGTKIGLAPMHTWKPDAYSKSPAPIGALLSSALMPVAFIIMLRFKAVTDAAVGSAYSQHLLIAFGILSILIAAFSVLTVRNYKRLLAYSSVEHAGIMALGFAFGGVGALAGVLHMIYHSLVKASLFFTTGNFFLKYHSAHTKKVMGAMTIVPATSIVFFVGLFAITGFPPFGIFLTELSTLFAGLGAYNLVVMLALAAMATVFIGFFRQANAMVFTESPKQRDIPKGEQSIWLLLPPALLLALVLLLTFYTPPFMQTLIHEAVARY